MLQKFPAFRFPTGKRGVPQNEASYADVLIARNAILGPSWTSVYDATEYWVPRIFKNYFQKGCDFPLLLFISNHLFWNFSLLFSLDKHLSASGSNIRLQFQYSHTLQLMIHLLLFLKHVTTQMPNVLRGRY